MTARKMRRTQVPDHGDMQANVEAAMYKLQSWLPDDLCKDYIPALAEKYIYARFDAICAPVPLTAKQIESQLLAIKQRIAGKLGEATRTGD